MAPQRFLVPTLLLASSLLLTPATAQTRARDRVTQAIDNRNTVRLSGNLHPLARPEFDRGAVPSGQRMERMILVLAPDAARQADLDQLVAAQHNPASPQYRRWITPEEYGSRFGISQHDLDQIQNWLTGEGLQVDEVPAGMRTILFNGPAGRVGAAFHTEIHNYFIDGKVHRANASEPSIPRALSFVVAGVASLHDFQSQPALASMEPAVLAPAYSSGGTHYMSPADFATIYDVTPLYSNSVDGAGTSIAVVARSNVYMTDVTSFRSTMGLPVNNPTIIVNGTDPGVVAGGEQMEATLDVEWAGAIARKAAVKVVVSASGASDGALLSAQYIVNHNTAPVMTTSFSTCEASAGTAYTQFWNSLWQQAAAEGITSLVASGDSGAAGCDSQSASTATQGKGVNALASSPYAVAVGGTQFSDATNSNLYWSAATNTATMGSALTYIPEVVWNNSSSSGLWASGGGASIVFAKPSWQTGVGVPTGSFRTIPDVSAAASPHDGYLVTMNAGLYVVGGTSAASPAWAGLMALVVQRTASPQGNANPNLYSLFRLQSAGGAAVFHDITSGNNSVPGVTGFTAGAGYDEAAGIGAPDAFQLVQHWNDTAGPSLRLSVSSSSASVAIGSSAQATASVAVAGGFSASVALSASGLPVGLTASFSPSTVVAPGSGSSTIKFGAAAGITAGVYNLTITATGGGIVQTVPLAVTVVAPSFTLAADPTSMTVQQGGTGQSRLTVATSGGFSAAIALSVSGLPAGITAAFSPAALTAAGSSTLTFTASTSATPGTANVTVSAIGGGVSRTLTIAITVPAPPTFSLSATPPSLSFPQSGSGQVALLITPSSALSSATVISVSGLPEGVTATSVALTQAGSVGMLLSASSTAVTGVRTLTFSATTAGVTKTTTVALTITALPFTLSASATALALAPGGNASAAVTVTSVSGFTSLVTLAAGGLPAGVTVTFTPATLSGPGSHSSTMRISSATTAKPIKTSITITATGGGATVSIPLALSIHGSTSAVK